MSSLSEKPWQRTDAGISAEIYEPHWMLGPEEREALFWIGREYCRGRAYH